MSITTIMPIMPIMTTETFIRQHRPKSNTMEGYLLHADQVLSNALHPRHNPVRNSLARHARECKGLAILKSVKVGAVLSFYYGTGVLLTKKVNGTWSAPSSLYAGGYSMGAAMGAKTDSVLVFIMDDETLELFLQRKIQTNMGLTADLAVGSRHYDNPVAVRSKGTVSYVLSSGGLYGGASVELGSMGIDNRLNRAYYNKKELSVKDLLSNHRVQVDPESQVPALYKKLVMLQTGRCYIKDELNSLCVPKKVFKHVDSMALYRDEK